MAEQIEDKVIEYDVSESIDEDTQKMWQWEDTLKKLSNNDLIIISELTKTGRDHCENVSPDMFSSTEQILDYIRDEFMEAGERKKFLIQAKFGKKLAQGFSLTLVKKKSATVSKERDEKIVDRLFSRIESLESRFVENKNEDETEKKMLEKMMMYKELFSNGNNSNMSEMMGMFQTMLTMSKEFQPPEKENGLMEQIAGPLLMGLLGKQNGATALQNPQIIEARKKMIMEAQKKQQQTQQPNQEELSEEDQMKIFAYKNLLRKIKLTAVCENQEEKEEKKEAIIGEIFGFFPEISQLAQIEDINISDVIEEYSKRFGIQLTDQEKSFLVEIAGDLKSIVLDLENEEKEVSVESNV